MGYLMDILIGAVSRIVTGELTAHLERAARWIINNAADRLPMCQRERFREEWIAHLDETPGLLRKLLHAIGCRLAASALANILVLPAAVTSQNVENDRHYRRFLEIIGKADSELSAWERELGRMPMPWADFTDEKLREFADALVTVANGGPGITVKIDLSKRSKRRARAARPIG